MREEGKGLEGHTGHTGPSLHLANLSLIPGTTSGTLSPRSQESALSLDGWAPNLHNQTKSVTQCHCHRDGGPGSLRSELLLRKGNPDEYVSVQTQKRSQESHLGTGTQCVRCSLLVIHVLKRISGQCLQCDPDCVCEALHGHPRRCTACL